MSEPLPTSLTTRSGCNSTTLSRCCRTNSRLSRSSLANDCKGSYLWMLETRRCLSSKEAQTICLPRPKAPRTSPPHETKIQKESTAALMLIQRSRCLATECSTISRARRNTHQPAKHRSQFTNTSLSYLKTWPKGTSRSPNTTRCKR
jgi:hypothetical protein